MVNESITIPSVTSTPIQHGGPQAAMPVSSPDVGGESQAKQASVEPAVKPPQEISAHTNAQELSKQKALMEKQAQELQERLDNLSKMKGWTINFSLVPEFEQPVVKVIDSDTKQVIRQIPSEEMLLMNKRLQAMEQDGGNVTSLSGILFDGQV